MKPDRNDWTPSRRSFLATSAALAGAALTGGAPAWPQGPRTGKTFPASDREGQAYQVRLDAAELQRELPAPRHETNGDEESLPRRIASFSKCLPHDGLGEVDPRAYDLLLRALASGNPRDFETVPIGGHVKLANPQAALAFNLIGPDPSRVGIAPPPRFGSAEQAAEAVELAWQALVRDVPFSAWDGDPAIARAADELSRLAGFRGPREEGRVTPATIFRLGAGDLGGPYVSQFLWKDIPFTPVRVEQKLRVAATGLDHLSDFESWLACQRGAVAPAQRYDRRPRYILTARDLGEYVRRDFTYQAFLGACLILLKMGALPDGSNPYSHSRTQSGFATFGSPCLFHLLAVVTQAALTACWHQKWLVHRRLRPEELFGRVEVQLRNRSRYPLHEDLLGSAALEEIRRRRRTALLPVAFPEGCPAHPSYPAGHAVIGGACVTVLKAFFDESYVIPDPVVPAADGLSLVRHSGPPLTVGGELDKLAANIGMGRDFAGVHWRSDTAEGLRFGEEVAVRVLREMRLTGNEMFQGFSFRRLDGTRITV